MGLDRAGGGFFVLKTEQWAMDGIDDLKNYSLELKRSLQQLQIHKNKDYEIRKR